MKVRKPVRQSSRLPGYDYTQPGFYFVTVCAYHQRCIFGDIDADTVRLNDAGQTAAFTCKWLAQQYPHVELDEFVIMPNHMHGLIIIQNGDDTRPGEPGQYKSLGRLVGAFKTVSTRRINLLRGTPQSTVWQRGFYEHVVRTSDSLERIRAYINTNPVRWALDPENPQFDRFVGEFGSTTYP